MNYQKFLIIFFFLFGLIFVAPIGLNYYDCSLAEPVGNDFSSQTWKERNCEKTKTSLYRSVLLLIYR